MCPKACFLKPAWPLGAPGGGGNVDMQGWSITGNDF